MSGQYLIRRLAPGAVHIAPLRIVRPANPVEARRALGGQLTWARHAAGFFEGAEVANRTGLQ
ncbi:hypothetical protein [Primorskyibacter flagellatus]|uniref:hypothetical protein n=1 Tax=Primorskyibacter flagellatus TaxID=1387277 RepID=UPI003A8E76EE